MALKVSRACDRCKTAYGDEVFDLSKPIPQLQRPTLSVTMKNPDGSEIAVLASFADLCPSCDKAVTNYVTRIRMEREEKPGKKGKDAAEGASEEGEARSEKADSAPTALVERTAPAAADTANGNGGAKPTGAEAF